jgi:hypothetical protein
MQRISSRLTFFCKFILPLGIAYYLIRMLFEWLATTNPNPNMPPTFIPYIFLGYFIWSAWIGWPLKKVSIFGDKLYVSNYLKEIVIPISEIINVSSNIFIGPQRVTIYFRDETEFGSEIIFLAKYRWVGRWSAHPIVNELLEMARSQNQAGFLTRPTQ